MSVENRGNGHEFNRRYLTCQMSAILYADRGSANSQSLHRAHLAIFADRGDRRIKSQGVSPVLLKYFYKRVENDLRTHQTIFFKSILLVVIVGCPCIDPCNMYGASGYDLVSVLRN